MYLFISSGAWICTLLHSLSTSANEQVGFIAEQGDINLHTLQLQIPVCNELQTHVTKLLM